jgi:NADH-quinone oxidoreductase subunit N
MNLSQIVQDLGFLTPEILLTGLILLAIIYDLFLTKETSIRTGYLAIAGMAIVLFSLFAQNVEASQGLFNQMVAYDGYARYFKIIITLATILVMWMSFQNDELKNRTIGEYYQLMLVLVFGMFFLVSATNMLSIYLSLEIVSIMSYLLAGYLKENLRSNESAIKYVVFGGVSSGIMLYGISLIYGLTGSLNIYEIQASLAANAAISPALLMLAFVLVFVGFGYKIAAVPFHFWTPDVYEGAPATITAFLSVAPKAAGFAVLLRFLNTTLTLSGDPNNIALESLSNLDWPTLLAGVSAITMTVGNVVALQQTNIKRMLAYSSIAHAGYMLMGVVVMHHNGVSAILYYAGIYTLMNLGAFFVAIYIKNAFNTETISDYTGLGYKAPMIGIAMAVFMFSLTGLPPTGGFVAKFYLFRGLVGVGDTFIWLAIVGLINGVVSLYYYLRVLYFMYFKEMNFPDVYHRAPLQFNILIVIIIIPLLFGWMIGDPLSTWTASATSFFVP